MFSSVSYEEKRLGEHAIPRKGCGVRTPDEERMDNNNRFQSLEVVMT
jgi:hypothetical protein